MMTTAITPVPLLDLAPSQAPLQAATMEALAAVVAHGLFIQGPEVRAFEADIVAWAGCPLQAIACANGSDAIFLALAAWDIGPGDEVIVPDFTFTSSATSVLRTGATPVLVDIRADDWLLDPDAVVAALTPATRAVVAVHLFGHPLDIPGLRRRLDDAGRADVRILEDTAQAQGTRWRGLPVGTLGCAGTLSFFPSKNLGAFGDGGMVLCPDPDHAARVRALATHGSSRKYWATDPRGINSRLDTLQAAILRVRLPQLDAWCTERRTHAAAWIEGLCTSPHAAQLRLPPAPDAHPDAWPTFHQFTVEVPRREAVMAALQDVGVGHAVYYPHPLSHQPALAATARCHDAPVAQAASRRVLSLPCWPGLDTGLRDEAIARTLRVLDGVLGG
jgi:dTDP-4-amino-4,6-dideoxygalactose transaminase